MAASVLASEWFAERPKLAIYIAVAIISLPLIMLLRASEDKSAVPKLPATVPFVTNALHHMTDMKTFLTRAEAHLAKTSKNIISWNITPLTRVYTITSSRYIQALFRPTHAISSDNVFHLIFKRLWGAPAADRAKFLNDKSGRTRVPLPGTENTPPERRYFAALQTILHDHLVATAKANALAAVFYQMFEQELDKRFPVVGQSVVVGVKSLLSNQMATAATASLAGRGILERWPNLIDMLWDFDEVVVSLFWGLPEWMNRSACKTRDRFRDACSQYVEEVIAKGYDLERDDADWEPVLGSSCQREFVRWMRGAGFSKETVGGAIMLIMIFGTNGNTTPVTAWYMMEIVKDKNLLKAVREEVMTALIQDPRTGARTIDVQKLVALPLLQSIYVELMRLHVSVNVTRELTAPFDLDGYRLEKGSLIQACTGICHLDENVWGHDKHPAREFWAARHIKYVEETDENGDVKRVPRFSMAGRQNDWFPYGGGVSICPGRHFAKQEIILTVAILVAKFDMEFVEWVNKDGTPSDRPAQDDVLYIAAASVPPDREMMIRWTRRW